MFENVLYEFITNIIPCSLVLLCIFVISMYLKIAVFNNFQWYLVGVGAIRGGRNPLRYDKVNFFPELIFYLS